MIVVFVNSCREVRFDRKDLLRPPSRPRKKEKKRYREDESRQLRRCHNRLTIMGRAGHGTLPWPSKTFNSGQRAT